MGTVWTGGDVSARYERAAIAAQNKLDSSIANTSKTNELSDLVESPILSKVPAGKAKIQAEESQEQVLADKEGGGMSVLREEAEEERAAEKSLRTSNHRRTASNSLKGLRQRVGSFGRKGGIIGVEKR